MAEVVVVGAGIAGLTAAINCARRGHEVYVWEQYKHIGGIPYSHPAVDITPMDPQMLGEVIGIELGSPQVLPAETVTLYIYGKRYKTGGEHFSFQAVERGERPTSLDVYLYEMAREEGVRFEMGKEINRRNFAELPPGSIIATGLNPELYELLGLPCTRVYGYVAKGETDAPARVVGWFDYYTRDYSYYACANGINFGLLFDRKPMDKQTREKWEKQLWSQEGVEFSSWHPHEGIVPIKSPRNPRFLWKDKILAGTFAGFQDPVMLFGVHGALLSGKIAAMAVDDKERAMEMFRRFTSFFKYSWLVKKMALDWPPHLIRKILLRTVVGLWGKNPEGLKFSIDFALGTIPGYRTMEKHRALIDVRETESGRVISNK